MKNIVISEGRSNAYLVHGVGVLALMSALAFWSVFAFLLFPLAMILFFSDSGVEIDPRALQVRKYIGFATYRKGIWIPLKHFTKVELEETLVLFQHRSFFRYQPSTSRTFDVEVHTANGDKFQINDFFDYEQAVMCGEVIARLSKINFQNRYAEKTAEMMSRQRRR